MIIENEISKIIVDRSFHIHTQLGPGLLESVYEEILSYELINSGLKIERQKSIPVKWNQITLEIGFRADIIVESCVVIEIKSVETLVPVFYKQLLTYLKLTDTKLGLLINFNEPLIKNGIKRIVNHLELYYWNFLSGLATLRA